MYSRISSCINHSKFFDTISKTLTDPTFFTFAESSFLYTSVMYEKYDFSFKIRYWFQIEIAPGKRLHLSEVTLALGPEFLMVGFSRWGCQFDPLLLYISWRTNLILKKLKRFLNDLKVWWKWKNADTICFKLASLVSLEQGIVKNPKNWCKSMKIAKHNKSSYILNNFRNLKNVFRKDVIYDNINKSGGFHAFLRPSRPLATFLGL